MGRSKQNKTPKKDSDGRHRKETKEERRIRLEKQAEAREACLRRIPIILGVLLVLVVAFAIYVRSVPPREVSASSSKSAESTWNPDFVNEVVIGSEKSQDSVDDSASGDTVDAEKEGGGSGKDSVSTDDIEL